ncbi:MAG TPA: hypothetical protein VEB19_09835 [Gemmatimonadaceae bacterium]|nr:hypothetical protein [Gemmatimonadaceae bacterium]
MRIIVAGLLSISLAGCTRLPWARANNDATGIESIYWRAVGQLDTASTALSVESARALLDGYLSSTQKREHVREAMVLRRLTDASIQLAKVETSLRVSARTTENKPDAPDTKRDAEPKRDEEAVKEIQRLKDELSKANAELERIRRRLANPKEPAA